MATCFLFGWCLVTVALRLCVGCGEVGWFSCGGIAV